VLILYGAASWREGANVKNVRGRCFESAVSPSPSIIPSAMKDPGMFGTVSSRARRSSFARSSHLAAVTRSSSMATASRPVRPGE